MKLSWSQITTLVESRAGSRCEYCRMHQSLQGATFHVEHILPSVHGGSSEPENLAWCCPSCNLRMSDRIEAFDPVDGARVCLFHPREAKWSEHFTWEGYELVGRSPIGRATIAALDLNHPRRLLIRLAEQRFGLFPPDDAGRHND